MRCMAAIDFRDPSIKRIAPSTRCLSERSALTFSTPGVSRGRAAFWLDSDARQLSTNSSECPYATRSRVCVRFDNSGQKVYKGGDLLMTQFEPHARHAAYNAEASGNLQVGPAETRSSRIGGTENAAKP
jgi:hypothetical protein